MAASVLRFMNIQVIYLYFSFWFIDLFFLSLMNIVVNVLYLNLMPRDTYMFLCSLVKVFVSVVLFLLQVNMRLKWVLENNEQVKKLVREGNVMFGTIDCWLIYKLSEGKVAFPSSFFLALSFAFGFCCFSHIFLVYFSLFFFLFLPQSCSSLLFCFLSCFFFSCPSFKLFTF